MTTIFWDKGIEVVDAELRPILTRITASLTSALSPYLSPLCWHLHGGCKALLNHLTPFLLPGDFIFKTDVHSYYASMNHHTLMHQVHDLSAAVMPPSTVSDCVGSVIHFITRSIFGRGWTYHPKIGIPKGGSLSPLLGAIYLNPLDTLMEKWVARGDVYYARYMDDLILVASKRSVFRRAKQAMLNELHRLQLTLRPEKTYLGRWGEKGFDFLGYHLKPLLACPSDRDGDASVPRAAVAEGEQLDLTVSEMSIIQAIEKGKQCYAQRGQLALATYLMRWRSWASGGLKLHKKDEFFQTLQGLCYQIEQKVRMSVDNSPPPAPPKNPTKEHGQPLEHWKTGTINQGLELVGTRMINAQDRGDRLSRRRGRTKCDQNLRPHLVPGSVPQTMGGPRSLSVPVAPLTRSTCNPTKEKPSYVKDNRQRDTENSKSQ
jgi:hypothetical protein